MRLATFNHNSVGIVEGDHITEIVLDGQPSGFSPMRQIIDSTATTELGALQRGATYALGEVTLSAPVPDPTKVMAAPVNYRDHQQEMNEDIQVSGLGLFLKAPSSLTGSGQQIVLPYTDRRFDQEGELAVIIGKTARSVAAGDALAYVFGYTALLDITMRGGEDRSTRKSFETFTPMGPWLVTADEFGRPDDVQLSCSVNGKVRQTASTRDLIWSVAELVSYASSMTTLNPGDVISTGTPAGVGPLQNGDVVEVEIEGLGAALQMTVSNEGAVTCPTTGKDRGPVAPPEPLAVNTSTAPAGSEGDRRV